MKKDNIAIIKMHVLTKFNEEIMIFDDIREHLLILTFYMAQIRHSEVPLRKRAIEFEAEVLDTADFYRTRLL